METGRKKIKEKEEHVVFTSFINNEFFMCEQCYDSVKNQSYYIKWDKKKKSFEKIFEIKIDEVVHKPTYGEELQIRAVLLPTEPLEYGTDKKLDTEIVEHIHKWLDVPKDYEKFAMYNIKLSWVYDKFNSLSYTRALGDTGSGKSRFLFTLGHLHYKPMIVAGCLTPAVIFRLINKWKGTLLIDEGDQDSSDETNSFIKIMNCGYERGMPVSRCNRDNNNSIDFFDVFCPKVITTRKRFDDKATESRCMTTIMVQTARRDIYDNLTKGYYENAHLLRNKLLMWKFRNYDTIDPEAGAKIDLNRYEPRLRQVNRAFISLFVNDEKALNKFFTHLDKYQDNILQERAESFDGILVNALAEKIINGNEHISCGDIVTQLSDTSFQYPLTVRTVGKIFRGMGVNITPMKVKGCTKKCFSLDKELLQTIFQRYIIDSDIMNDLIKKGYPVTVVTVVTHTAQKGFQAKTKNRGGLGNYGNYGNSVTGKVSGNRSELMESITKHIQEHSDSKGDVWIEVLKDKLQITDEIIDKYLSDGDAVTVLQGKLRLL